MKYLFKILSEFSSKLLVLIALVFAAGGAILVVAQPPFHAPDEPWHWQTGLLRTERLLTGSDKTCGQAVSLPWHFETGTAFHAEKRLPQNLFSTVEKIEGACFPNTTPEISYGNVLSYPGVLLGRFALFGQHSAGILPLIHFMSSRLIHLLIVFLCLIRFVQLGLYTSRTGGWSFGLLSIPTVTISPIFLQQASAISGDAVVNAAALMFCAWALFSPSLTLKDALLGGIVGAAAVTTKPVVMPLAAAATLVVFVRTFPIESQIKPTKWNFKNIRLNWKNESTLVLITGFALVALGLWSGLNSKTALQGDSRLGPDVNAARQLEYVLSHQKSALFTFFEGTTRYMSFESFFGKLGWLDTTVPKEAYHHMNYLYRTALVLDALLVAASFKKHSFKPGLIKIFIAVILGSIAAAAALSSNFLTAVALYFSWTPVGSEIVNGIQPRYSLPAYIFLLAAIGSAIAFAGSQIEYLKISANTAHNPDEPESSKTQMICVSAAILTASLSATAYLSHLATALLTRYW